MALDVLRGFFALLIFILPGWLWARTRRLPLPALAGFIFGAVVLVLLIQLLELVGARLSTGIVLMTWSILSFAIFSFGKVPLISSSPPGFLWRKDWLLMLPLVPAFMVTVYRTVFQPLFGVDTVFRWNFLAQLMLERRSIAFYPPSTAMDYAIYAWPDGIAPVVSSLYFWVYNLAGAARPVLTAPVIIFQLVLLLAAVHGLARRLGSPRAGAIACSLVACSPILLWSTAMGQESGVLTLALLGLLFYLPGSREGESTSATILAGLAAAMGGLAREYALSFILFGLALGIFRRLSPRTLVIFFLTATMTVLPWYLRNWVRTGNPLFNLDIAGLFPVNNAQLRLMKIYQTSFGWDHLPPEALQISLTNCMAALVGGTAGILYCFKRMTSLLFAIILMGTLWMAALGYTAAGFTYSLRVLTPALAIAAILGGTVFARWVPERTHLAGLTFALFIFAADAALRTLALPANIYKIPPRAWLEVGGAIQEYHQRPVYLELVNYTGGQRILVLGPAALLNQNGARTVPFWSPELQYLWSESCTSTEAARKLIASGISFVLINKGEVNRKYITQIPVFAHSLNPTLQQIWEDGDMTLFKVVEPATSTVPDRPGVPPV